MGIKFRDRFGVLTSHNIWLWCHSLLSIRAFSMAAISFSLLAFFALPASAQITSLIDPGGRKLFINAEPPPKPFKLMSAQPRTNIYLPAEASFTGQSRPSMSIDRDGAEKLAKEAAERHNVDPALVRAVILTESGWNSGAISRKGAVGLMQLIPTTGQRYGANDLFNPKQNLDAGVRHLKMLLERYNGNMDLALAAYNAGEGAVDRAHGVPPIRETRDYVQKIKLAYNRPGSGRFSDGWTSRHAIRKDVSGDGRIVFTND
jgi:soluble lytic murein transglycosylase-like protein